MIFGSFVQELAAGPLLQGRNVVLAAETGSGKTFAYLGPIISQICEGITFGRYLLPLYNHAQGSREVEHAAQGNLFNSEIDQEAEIHSSHSLSSEAQALCIYNRAFCLGKPVNILTPGWHLPDFSEACLMPCRTAEQQGALVICPNSTLCRQV